MTTEYSSAIPPAPVSLESACAALPDLWSPRVLGRVNDQYIKVARVLGEFPWHTHAAEDEMFLVLRGELLIGRSESDGGSISVRAGEFFVVPRGVPHNTSAATEAWIALIETVTTQHTGADLTPMTRSLAEQLGRQTGEQQGKRVNEQLDRHVAEHVNEDVAEHVDQHVAEQSA